MVGEHDPREVYPCALAAEFQQWQQPPVEQRAFLHRGVSVVENLGEERVEPHVGTEVVAEEEQRVELLLRLLRGALVLLLAGEA